MRKSPYLLYCILFFLFSRLIFCEKISDISTPEGYTRINYNESTFSGWIQNLKTKYNRELIDYRGRELSRQYSVMAVVEMELLFEEDLEQCADYCMRFWAEYHITSKKTEKLFLYNYSGKKEYYKSDKNMKKFLRTHFANSNSYSIKMGATPINENQIMPGDMIVQNSNGGIGHVSMIMDECINSKGEKLYLIGFSFMPAQEFHIERAENSYGQNGWFTLKGYYKFLKERLDFGKPVLRRF